MNSAGATLLGSFSGATGTISDHGFRYRKVGTSSWETVHLNGTSAKSGSFKASIDGLSANTNYEYQAFVVEYDASTGNYVDRWGTTVKTFTTPSSSITGRDYLDCYEVPALTNLSGTGTSGTKSSWDDNWFRYYTTNSKQQVATHTFTHPSLNKQVRNYTVLYDGNRYCPLWTAAAYHSSMWANNGVERSNSWDSDPAISLTQQTGLDNASSVGYDRGHFVASADRKTTDGQNAQTFYYSNQAPQNSNFNGGLWNSLENKVQANYPSGRDTLYVVTGVLFEGTVQTKPSGSLNVSIPSHFYKCLMLCSFNSSGTMTDAKGIAYIYENVSYKDTGKKYNDSEFVTTIDAVESRAGFDFFPKVPSNLQSQAENGTSVLTL